jgi:hypothetical protein
LIIAVVLAMADRMTATSLWRWLIIGIYAWSAWSKMDTEFCHSHGQFLLDGFARSIGIEKMFRDSSESFRANLACAIPIVEIVIAAGLTWHRTRLVALVGSIAMHIVLLMALGPFGHGHKPGVLVWNSFFIVQNWLLFRDRELNQFTNSTIDAESKTVGRMARFRIGNQLARLFLAICLLWPAVESMGWCDHWPAWAVYASRPERVTVLVHTDEIEKLSADLNSYISPRVPSDGWAQLRIDRWSLNAVLVPIYPQDRYQIGVALWVVNTFQLNTIRVVIESPAQRWNGTRITSEYVGTHQLEQLARRYRLNAIPRVL